MRKGPSLLALFPIAVVLTACTAGIRTQPAAGAAATPGAPAVAPANRQKRSWIKPGVASQKLLYVTDVVTDTVAIYTYPGLTYAGELTGFSTPNGTCADRAGNVWIVDGFAGKIFEYAHAGTSPVNTLNTGQFPAACAINRKTGDLAITMSVSGAARVAVFRDAAGSPTMYADSAFYSVLYLGFDGGGNLYVDGVDPSFNIHLAELPAGSSTFTDFSPGIPGLPGDVKWDGTYVAVGNQEGVIYQTQGGTVVGSTVLSSGCSGGFDILPGYKKIVAPDPCGANADVYSYPGGGSPTKNISGGLTEPVDAVLSI